MIMGCTQRYINKSDTVTTYFYQIHQIKHITYKISFKSELKLTDRTKYVEDEKQQNGEQ